MAAPVPSVSQATTATGSRAAVRSLLRGPLDLLVLCIVTGPPPCSAGRSRHSLPGRPTRRPHFPLRGATRISASRHFPPVGTGGMTCVHERTRDLQKVLDASLTERSFPTP